MTPTFAAWNTNPQAAVNVHKNVSPLKSVSPRNSYHRQMIALGMIVMLAGCQSVPSRSGKAASTASKSDTIILPADGKHRVALLLPITGPDGDVGRSIANATAMALIDTGNTKISVQTYDTALGVDAAARRAMQDGSMLILGPLRSDNVIEVAGIARARNVPIITFSNDIGVAGRNVYLLGHLPNQSIDRIVRYSKARGLNRFAAIVPRNVYGQRAASSVTSSVAGAGGSLVDIEEVDGSSASLNAAVQKLKASGPVDAVIVADAGKSAIATVTALRSAGMKARILGTELWNVDTMLPGSNMMQGAWFASVPDGFFRQYATKYRARYNRAPLRISSLGYDSVLLVGKVMPNWKLGTTFPLGKLTDKDGFIGLDGAFRFSPSGLSDRTLEVQEVQRGQYVTVDAAPKVFGN